MMAGWWTHAGNYRFTTTEKGEFYLRCYQCRVQNNRGKGDNRVGSDHPRYYAQRRIERVESGNSHFGSFAASDTKRAATVLNSIDVATVGGGNADITAARAKTLPGAQQVGEQEGLFVRGGAGYETKQFIDGTLVNNPYFTSVPDIATRGRFSPFLFKGTVFSTGGYSALYGQALSSAVILSRSTCRNALQRIFLYRLSFLVQGFSNWPIIRSLPGVSITIT